MQASGRYGRPVPGFPIRRCEIPLETCAPLCALFSGRVLGLGVRSCTTCGRFASAARTLRGLVIPPKHRQSNAADLMVLFGCWRKLVISSSLGDLHLSW